MKTEWNTLTLSPLAQKYLPTYGGKVGGFLALQEYGGFDNYLPTTEVFSELPLGDQRTWKSRGESEGIIFRTGSEHDYFGYVDVMPTVLNLDNSRTLSGIAAEAREGLTDPRFIAYSRAEQGDEPKNIFSMIQDYHVGIGGSIVTHPNREDSYAIEIRSADGGFNSSITFDRNEPIPVFSLNFVDRFGTTHLIDELVALKDSTDEILSPTEMTTQMEWVFDPRSGYKYLQTRLFQRKHVADFNLLDDPREHDIFIPFHPQLFGVTPAEGLRGTIRTMNEVVRDESSMSIFIDKPTGPGHHDYDTKRWIPPIANKGAYLLNSTGFQEHGAFKNSQGEHPVLLLGSPEYAGYYGYSEKREVSIMPGMDVQIISDGHSACIDILD